MRWNENAHKEFDSKSIDWWKALKLLKNLLHKLTLSFVYFAQDGVTRLWWSGKCGQVLFDEGIFHPQLINQLVMLKCFPATTRASWNLYLCINNLSTSALGERNNFEGVNSQGMISFLRSFSSNLTFANLQIYFLIQKNNPRSRCTHTKLIKEQLCRRHSPRIFCTLRHIKKVLKLEFKYFVKFIHSCLHGCDIFDGLMKAPTTQQSLNLNSPHLSPHLYLRKLH